jgi:hypothetical protein
MMFGVYAQNPAQELNSGWWLTRRRSTRYGADSEQDEDWDARAHFSYNETRMRLKQPINNRRSF